MKSSYIVCFLLTLNISVAQEQQIGIIDFFGLHRVTEQQAKLVLGLSVGDTVPMSMPAIEEQLKDSLHVSEAHISVVCCDDSGNLILFVGIRENPLKHPMYRSAPHWDISLPSEITDAYNHFFEAFELAVSKGKTGDDLSQGHSLMTDSASRAWQEKFPVFAKHHLQILKTVLRNSADAEQRAIAAYVIGYASDKRLVTDDLLLAAIDEDEVVRNNAARALAAIATLAQRRPALKIKISATPFINMLSSATWTDRNKALMVLAILTYKRDHKLLRQIHERAFGELVEMARWKSRGHAFNAFIILGRIAGISERTLENNAWELSRRNAMIDRIVKSSRKK